jgi:hypothetical protein
MTTLPLAGVYYRPWICETHLRELDDLETSGEISEGKERLAEIVQDYRTCEDCTELKGAQD